MVRVSASIPFHGYLSAAYPRPADSDSSSVLFQAAPAGRFCQRAAEGVVVARRSPAFQLHPRRKSKPAPRSIGASAAAKQWNAVLCVLLAMATIPLYVPGIGRSFGGF